ncbi:type II secretion system F family protein [Nocardioides pakistanensis]
MNAVAPSALGVVAALLVGLAGWLALAPGPGAARRPRAGGRDTRVVGRRSDREIMQPLVAVMAGAAPVVLVGGAVGWLSAPVVAVLVHRAMRDREPARERRRREQVSRSLPQVVDLLAVTLAAGASPGSALTAVAEAVEGPVAEELHAVEHSLALGRDPAGVWREVARRPGMGPLGRSMSRAIETGASVSGTLHRLAEDLHAQDRSEAESRARAVGVRAAAPLGLCLLPAFVVVGVVPLVASTAVALLRP